jgi:hypothetical protein
MSSWALLLALSGATADVATGTLGFAPRWSADDFRCLFTAGTAWGTYAQRTTREGLAATIEVEDGRFLVRRLRLGTPDAPAEVAWDRVEVRIDGRPVEASLETTEGGLDIRLATPPELRPGARLSVACHR